VSHLTRDAVFEIFADNIWYFGAHWGYPARGAFVFGTDNTIMQNFTPIGVTVVEISVTGHIHKYKELHQTSYQTNAH